MLKDFSNSLFFRISLLILIIISGLLVIFFQNDFKTLIQPQKISQSQITTYGSKLPIRFERNDGQVGEQIDFLCRGKDGALFLTATEMVLNMWNSETRSHTARGKPESQSSQFATTLQMQLVGANSESKAQGLDERVTKSNYLIGNDSEKWLTNIPNYGRVKYREVYPGIDVVYYGRQGKLEYDFVLAPGADPNVISLQFEGSEDVSINVNGNLNLSTAAGKVTMQAPLAYQDIAGVRKNVSVRYVLRSADQIGFEVGDYDPTASLVIDPVLVFSTYLGGINADEGTDIAVDSLGNAYITGQTTGTFPTTDGVLQPTFNGPSTDAIVAKVSASGSELIYATFIGGGRSDYGLGIAIDDEGNAYITGQTNSPDFPTQNAIQPNFGGDANDRDGFVVKLNPTGSALVYSTYLGGSGFESARDIAVDRSGNAYIVGDTGSSDFPTKNAIQGAKNGASDLFVTKINSTGTELVFSTYLGGSNTENGEGITVDRESNVYITGKTTSDDFPTVLPLQTARGSANAFVTKINAQGSALVYSTYLAGGRTETGTAIAVDSLGSAYVVGHTSSIDFPTTNAVQPNYGGGPLDCFVTKFSPDGDSLLYSTYLGGTGRDQVPDVAVDAAGNAYITGSTNSSNFPTQNPLQETLNGGIDAFVTKIGPAGLSIEFSSYLGGRDSDFPSSVAVDGNRNIYLTGWTNSADFPTALPLQPELGGISDAFVTKIDLMDKDKLEIIRITPDPLSPSWFWVERTLRPGEQWTFRTHFCYTLASANSGIVRMVVETQKGFLLGENMVEVNRATDALKLDFASPEVTIPEVGVDEVDTLYVKLKLFPTNEPDASASDSVFYRIFIHKWTFMVYLDGDNDLELASVDDFFEMAKAPSNDSLAVVILYDRHPGYTDLWFDPRTGNLAEGWHDTRRIFNHQDYYREISMGELNVGDPVTLHNFVQWALKTFPAQNYALVLWDHGGGWLAPVPATFTKSLSNSKLPELPPGGVGNRRGQYKDVIVDETDNDRLYSSEILSVLNHLPTMDVLGFDACLMGMVENAYQYRFGATHMVASEALEPGDGWPYDVILTALKKRPTMSTREVSQTIVQAYGASYPSHNFGITQAAIDLRWMDEIKKALDLLAGLLIEKKPWSDVESVLDDLKFFWPVPNRDLYHFAQLLKGVSQDEEIRAACDGLMQSIFSGVVGNYYSTPEENANGLAIFFPTVWAQYDASYDWVNNIKLSDDAQWNEFLRLFLSRRAPDRVLDTYEINDTFTQAYGPLLPETAYHSYISIPEDKDFYFIATGIQTDLWVTLTSPSVNYDLAVYDANGTLLGNSLLQDDVDSLHLANLPPSAYYIEVISNGLFLQQLPYKLEVNYLGSRTGRVPLSSDDGVPDSSLFSTKANDVIGANLHAPDYPMVLNEISYFIESTDGAGTGGDGSFSVWLADYYGTIVDPFTVTPTGASFAKGQQSGSWFTVDLADQDIKLQSDFFVGIAYDGQNTPALGIDTLDDGRTYQWDSATNNWRALEVGAFIRAKVSYLQTPDRVRISLPAGLYAEPDDTVSVSIEISNLPPAGVDSLDLEIYYEPAVLRFTALGRENTLTSDWQEDSLDSEPAGRIYIEMSGANKISSSGVLLNLQFHVQLEAAPGDTVELSLNHARLNGGQYFVETESGKIIIMTPTSVRGISNQPRKFALWQNYPNPFNPETTIRFELPQASEVTINIYNLHGQLIRELVNENKEAGFHEIVWDARDDAGRSLPSGVYLYRIQAGAFMEVRKLMLLR